MSVEILEARTRAERKRWVRFVFEHYRDHPFYVPQIFSDELDYFEPGKNPVFDVAAVKLFMAISDGAVVGRICGIINPLEEAKLGRKVARFGWFEAVDDQEVADRLLGTVRDWARAQGCVAMTGPHGFSDLDPGGILVEGFDQIPTISGSYHYPYYGALLEAFGLEKDVDYIEFRVDITQPVPFLERLSRRLSGEIPYTLTRFESRRKLLARADEFWAVLERAFEPLYGVVPLTPEQTRFYTKKYLSFLDPDFVVMAFDPEGEMVGFFIGIPNLSHAFRKARGRLLPFGWLHILREYRRPRTVDFLLAGMLPDESSAALVPMGLLRMYEVLRARGVQYLETNRELETNTAVNRVWRKFEVIASRRTRIYRLNAGGTGEPPAA